MAKTAKKFWNQKQEERGTTALRELPEPICMGCGKVKSLNHTRALFAVIEEDKILCHNCVEGA